MPKVGRREYTYDKKGIDAAKKEAKRTGKPLVMKKGAKQK